MEIIERISQIQEEKGKQSIGLAHLLNINTSTLSTWKTKRRDPPARYMPAIADYLGVSLDYLLTGSESLRTHDLTDAEKELLSLFRQLSPEKQQRYIGRIENELENSAKEQLRLDEGKRLSS